MTTFDLVILDFDGTLADTRDAVKHCMAVTLSEALGSDHSVSEQQLDGAIASGATLPEAFGILIATQPPDRRPDVGVLLSSYRRRYMSDALVLTRLYPGVFEVLAFLTGAGVSCVVFSNKGQEALRQTVSGLGIARFFEMVVGEYLQFSPKPDAAIFNQIIWPRYRTVERKRVLMVGDTVADMKFADNAGIQKCWARYGYGDERRCRDTSPHFEISDADQLRFIVSGGT